MYLCGNHSKLHPIHRAPVLEEEQIRLIGLVREHPDVHVLDKERGAHEHDGRAVGRVEVRLIYALDLEERRAQTVGLADVLGRMDVLDAGSVRDVVEVEGEGDFRQGHSEIPGRGGGGVSHEFYRQNREACETGDGQEEEEEQHEGLRHFVIFLLICSG